MVLGLDITHTPFFPLDVGVSGKRGTTPAYGTFLNRRRFPFSPERRDRASPVCLRTP